MTKQQSFLSRVLLIVAGGMILAFGLYNIHAQADVAEGGVLGLTLLLEHWLGVSPAISSFVIDAVCYFIGWRELGSRFMWISLFSAACFSIAYRLFEAFPPLFPAIADMPLVAAVAGAVCVGVGAGLSVRAGAAQGGDDALAMALSHRWGVRIKNVYLISDITVLLLSLSYIPLRRFAWSILTVFLSGQVIGLVLDGFPHKKKGSDQIAPL